MPEVKDWTIPGKTGGSRHVREWPNESAFWIALLAHGYGEHIGRYDHVAEALRAAGAVLLGPDHEGHGRSEGERVRIDDFETVVADLQAAAQIARTHNPKLPMVLIGHSMGGMIAARYAQRYGSGLSALVLSGPMFGARELLQQLMALDPIPDIPLDPALLSRDPAVGRAYAADPLVWHGPFKRPTLKAVMKCMDSIAAGPSLGAVPTLWVHGANDMLVPLEATRPMMTHLRGKLFEEKVYAGAMHEIFNETNKEEVIADVTAFIRRFVGKGLCPTP